MNAKLRSVPRIAGTVFLLLLFIVPGWTGDRGTAHGFPSVPAPDLDRALRAGDLDKARQLVPANWAGAEALFIDYLERAYSSPGDLRGQPDARTLAGRLADVFFRIVEYDFAPSLVSALNTADAATRPKLIAAARDLFSNLGQRRTLPRSSSDPNVDYNARGLPIFKALSDVADRFRELSFPRGELFALFCMADISPPVPRLHRLARELGDDLSLALVQRQSAGVEDPPWETLLGIADRHGLLSTQLDLLATLGQRRFQSARAGRVPAEQFEEAVKYLERARAVAAKIPTLETINYEWYTAPGPQVAGFGMPQLFGAYVTLKRLQSAGQVLAEAVQLSQPFGEDALLNTVASCAGWAGGLLSWEDARPLLLASPALGAKAELRMARGLAGSGRNFRLEMAETALALAIAIPDARERGLTLAWYSRSRQSHARAGRGTPSPAPPRSAQPSATDPAAFPPLYHQLFKMCLEAGEFAAAAEALADQAEMHGVSGNAAGARDIFNEAIRTAERSGDKRLVARVVMFAATGLRSGLVPGGPVKRWPAAVQLDFAGRALEAAKAADSPRELLIAYWARATVPTATTDQRLADLRDAVAASERYTGQTGQVTNELRCLTQLSQEYVRRGEYQAAIDTERRRAERAHTFEPFEDFETQAYRGNRAHLLGEPGRAVPGVRGCGTGPPARRNRLGEVVPSDERDPSGVELLPTCRLGSRSRAARRGARVVGQGAAGVGRTRLRQRGRRPSGQTTHPGQPSGDPQPIGGFRGFADRLERSLGVVAADQQELPPGGADSKGRVALGGRVDPHPAGKPRQGAGAGQGRGRRIQARRG